MADIFKDLDARVVHEYNIEVVGSISAGKSQFISALAEGLRYSNIGSGVVKDKVSGTRPQRNTQLYKKKKKGFHRSNSTDKLEYGSFYLTDSKNQIFKFNFIAPGAHEDAEKNDTSIDGLIHIIDTNLGNFLDKELFNDKVIASKFGDGVVQLKHLLHTQHEHSDWSGSSYIRIPLDMQEEVRNHIGNYRDYKLELLKQEEIPTTIKKYKIAEDIFRLNNIHENVLGELVNIPILGIDVPEINDKLMQNIYPEYVYYNREKTDVVVDSLIRSDIHVSNMSDEVPVVGALRQAHYDISPVDVNGLAIKNVKIASKYAYKENNKFLRDSKQLFSLTKKAYERALDIYGNFLIETQGICPSPDILTYSDKYIGMHSFDSAVKNKRDVLQIAHELATEVLNRNSVESKEARFIHFGKADNKYAIGMKYLNL